MRPLLVGIFLNTVGLSTPRRKRYPAGTRDEIRCAPPKTTPNPYNMCHVYAYMCGICALKTSSRSFFSFWCLVVVPRALLLALVWFSRAFASHVVHCNNNLFRAIPLADTHVLTRSLPHAIRLSMTVCVYILSLQYVATDHPVRLSFYVTFIIFYKYCCICVYQVGKWFMYNRMSRRLSGNLQSFTTEEYMIHLYLLLRKLRLNTQSKENYCFFLTWGEDLKSRKWHLLKNMSICQKNH